MLGGTKMFTFVGSSLLSDPYGAVERNYEEYYYRLRNRGYVPVLGSEEINLGKQGQYSIDWTMNIVGKECDRPWDVRGVTQEGDIEWFTTPEDTSRTYSMVSV